MAWVSLIKLGGIPVPEHGSFSQLTTFMECEVKHRIGRSKLIPETPAWYLIGGTAMHAAVESWERLRYEFGRDLHGPSTLTGLFEQHFEDGIAEAEQAEPDRALWRAAKGGKEDEAFWRKLASNWCRTYASHAERYFPALIDVGRPALEVPFKITLGGIEVSGFIDQVVVAYGEWFVCDLKFGSSDGNPLQLGVYKVALQELYQLNLDVGLFFNPRKKDPIARHSVRGYSRPHLDKLFARFAEREALQPMPNMGRQCDWCEFRQVCPAWADTEGPFEL